MDSAIGTRVWWCIILNRYTISYFADFLALVLIAATRLDARLDGTGGSMPRAIWKGAISFGLVNIPVPLHSPTRPENDIKLRMLRASDQSPIKYKRVAEADDKEVPWEQIVKGYEYEKDEFVVVTSQDFDKVNVASNQTVD